MKYIPPKRGVRAFTCPHCGVLARQYHYSVNSAEFTGSNQHSQSDPIASSVCEHCGMYSLWNGAVMIYPNRGEVPLPNQDTPKDVKQDYEEAATIAALSPKAAAALLRLAIQKLCVHLGGKGENINDDIAFLVKNGLPEKVQQSLDIVRVVGNSAVHPGQIDIDDAQIVGNLFDLINVIVETMISVPKKIGNLYSSLPQGALDGIKKRDIKAK